MWFNPAGKLGQRLSEIFAMMDDMSSLGSVETRAKAVIGYLIRHPEITTLVGHSAGCTIIEEVLKTLPKEMKISKIVLMSPPPPKGKKFGRKDPVFWAMGKYLWKMFTGKHFMLSRSDVKNLLSVSEEKVDEVMTNLKPDSGRFAREMTMRQFAKPELFFIPDGIKVAVVTSPDDRMVGGKGINVSGNTRRSFACISCGGGHLAPLQRIDNVISRLKDMSFEF